MMLDPDAKKCHGYVRFPPCSPLFDIKFKHIVSLHPLLGATVHLQLNWRLQLTLSRNLTHVDRLQ